MTVFTVRQFVNTVNIWDNQTLVLRLPCDFDDSNKRASGAPADKELLIFVTATIVDATGARVHSDDEIPFAQVGVPPQDSISTLLYEPPKAGGQFDKSMNNRNDDIHNWIDDMQVY